MYGLIYHKNGHLQMLPKFRKLQDGYLFIYLFFAIVNLKKRHLVLRNPTNKKCLALQRINICRWSVKMNIWFNVLQENMKR